LNKLKTVASANGQGVDTHHDDDDCVHRVCVISADCCHTVIHMVVYRYALVKPVTVTSDTKCRLQC